MGLFNVAVIIDATSKMNKFVFMPLSDYAPQIEHSLANYAKIRGAAWQAVPRCSKRNKVGGGKWS